MHETIDGPRTLPHIRRLKIGKEWEKTGEQKCLPYSLFVLFTLGSPDEDLHCNTESTKHSFAPGKSIQLRTPVS